MTKRSKTPQVQIDPILARIPSPWAQEVSCRSGWWPLLSELDQEVSSLLPDYVIHQVKEKFGTLRFYWAIPEGEEGRLPGHDLESLRTKINALVAAAEKRSAEICEICGKPGRLTRIGGWWQTSCASHRPIPIL